MTGPHKERKPLNPKILAAVRIMAQAVLRDLQNKKGKSG
ncbi:hypothetical protein SOV_51260 [Sporomusa ovata DSM 2662]|uniref:Uncharacterized protein n=1 Tax=Sporomusa ovata TaxID=2378 RepID=A0A0U1L1C9_9FIRM|nr:hypothetical protein SOV_2c03950 [Sporomusa ovata DSM 2662]CQR73345.1 hypothetical protein SpAn4DRAFT_2577 [Sporomusa ovata]